MLDAASFERYVQEALEHLYDPAYLLTNPLTALLVPPGGAEPPGRALNRILRDAIAALKPSPDAPSHSPAWRSYRYLTLRYTEMLTIREVAEDLGISPRQCRRDHHDALNAVCAILRDQYLRQRPAESSADLAVHGPEETPAPADAGLLDAEVGKVGAASATGVSDLGQVAQSAVATIAALAARKNVDLRVAIPPILPSVSVDRTALRQMLVELILYAIDRGADGTLTVEAVSSAKQVSLNVVVRQREAEADPAITLDRDHTRLAVSRRLADMQGVSLAVEMMRAGFAIRLTFPTNDTPVVLVVDDNRDVVRLFRRYLEGAYHVLEAANGSLALSLAQEVQPQIITLDVMMPSQDGWEVLQLLKNNPSTSKIPIVVCSVLQERELALSLGAADFLAKPIMERDLRSTLQRYRSTG